MIYTGDYLSLPLTFINRHLIGFVLNSVFWVSGLIAVSSGLAWLMRTLFTTEVRSVLDALGFRDDVTRPFFPSVLLAVAWLVVWMLSLWRNRAGASGAVARVLLALLITSVLLGITTVLVTGDISADTISQLIGAPQAAAWLNAASEYVRVLVVAPILLFLLPYFRPDQLLRSGLSPSAKWWERGIFKLAGMARELAVDTEDWRRPVEVTNVNRELLSAYFGPSVVKRKGSSASITVVTDPDQATRVQVFWWALAIFVVAGLTVHLNVTSLQGFYRAQIESTWVADCGGFGRKVPLARLDTTAHGYPYHLISATANYLRRQQREQGATDHFLFSHRFCGTPRAGYVATSEYAGGNYDLASAIALSGAAVSPLQMKNLLLMILLAVLNFRLGQWLPNPGHRPWPPRRLNKALTQWPAPCFVVGSLMRSAQTRGYCLVTDGGHFENLGIGPLLSRRCRLIICSDVGHDPDYKFQDFVELLRRQRVDQGVEIVSQEEGVITFDALRPAKPKSEARTPQDRLSKAHFVIAKILYPRASELGDDAFGARIGYLIYVKPTLVEGMSVDVMAQQETNPDFPHDSSSDQFFTPEKFESYRQLGFAIAERLCHECFRDVDLTAWAPTDESGAPSEPTATFATDRAHSPSVPGGEFASEPQLSKETPATPQDRDTDAREEVVPASGVSDTTTPPADDSSRRADELDEEPGADAIEENISRLRSSDAATRYQALDVLYEALHQADQPSATLRSILDALCGFAKNDENIVKRDTAIYLVTKFVGDRDAQARRMALRLCANAAEPRQLRLSALELLKKIGLKSKESRDAMMRLCNDADAEISLRARDLLAEQHEDHPRD